MLPALHHAWAETTGALWSSRMIRTSPLGKVWKSTPGGIGARPALEADGAVGVAVINAECGMRNRIDRPRPDSAGRVPHLGLGGFRTCVHRGLFARRQERFP